MNREEHSNEMCRIMCELYNQEHGGHIQPDQFDLLPHYVLVSYSWTALGIMKENAEHKAALALGSQQTVEDDKRFIEEHPVNGDIDLSPHPLL